MIHTLAVVLRQHGQPQRALCLEATPETANLAEGRAALGMLSFAARICTLVDDMVVLFRQEQLGKVKGR